MSWWCSSRPRLKASTSATSFVRASELLQCVCKTLNAVAACSDVPGVSVPDEQPTLRGSRQQMPA